MKNKIIIFLSAIIATFSFVNMAMCAEPVIASDFSINDLNNKTFSLSSYKNKQPVLLIFWHTKCPLCREQLLLLKEQYPELKESGLEVLAINISQPFEIVNNYVEALGLNFPVLLDIDAEVADAYIILGVPTYVLIDKKGNTVFRNYYFPWESYLGLLSDTH